MISLIRAAWQEEMRVPMFVGLATDGYPDSDDPAMKNGARCYHMDTGVEYEYSKDDDAWYPVPSGGGGLPDVTIEDNGKFMRVVNGGWEATQVTTKAMEVTYDDDTTETFNVFIEGN